MAIHTRASAVDTLAISQKNARNIAGIIGKPQRMTLYIIKPFSLNILKALSVNVRPYYIELCTLRIDTLVAIHNKCSRHLLILLKYLWHFRTTQSGTSACYISVTDLSLIFLKSPWTCVYASWTLV